MNWFQVLNGNPYNRKCDVYSFGICLWEIYCCDMPYPDLSFSEITSAVVRQVNTMIQSKDLHSHHIKNPLISFYFLPITELKAWDTTLLPKFTGECNEEMLGCEPGPTAWNGWGSSDVGGNRYIKGRRNDPHWWTSRLFLVLSQVPWSLVSELCFYHHKEYDFAQTIRISMETCITLKAKYDSQSWSGGMAIILIEVHSPAPVIYYCL